jgi:DMSO/TMAO reductase YedYZ molybdopterin-dependent catalytic subunit
MARSIRPEQGYPLRLLVPGYEGNISIKWLRRLEVSDALLYAVTAYILSEAKIIAQDAVMDAKSLAAIKMPSRNGFIPDRRPEKFPTVAASPHQRRPRQECAGSDQDRQKRMRPLGDQLAFSKITVDEAAKKLVDGAKRAIRQS